MGLIQAVRYAFVNAKVRSMQSRLLGREGLQEVLQQGSLEGIASFLEEGEYSRLLAESLADFEVNLKEKLLDNANKIKISMPGGGASFYERFLGRYEIESMEAFFTGLYSGMGREEVLRTIPQHHHHLFEGVESLEDLASSLDLASEMESFKERGNIVGIDRALNQRYYEELFASIPGDEYELRELMGIEVDIENIKMALRYVLGGIREGFTPLPQGYEVPPWALEDVVGGGSLDRAASSLEGTTYYEPLVEALSNREEGEVRMVALDEMLHHKCQETIMSVPFGLSPLVAFTLLMEFEAQNLRAIVKLKAEDFGEEEIKKNLVGV